MPALSYGCGSKHRNSKMGCPGNWKHGPKPAVCPSDRLILSHTLIFLCLLLLVSIVRVGALRLKGASLGRLGARNAIVCGVPPNSFLRQARHAPQSRIQTNQRGGGSFYSFKSPTKGFPDMGLSSFGYPFWGQPEVHVRAPLMLRHTHMLVELARNGGEFGRE